MISLVRRYLITCLMLGSGLIVSWPASFFFGSVAAAIIIDSIAVRNVELESYRKGLDFDAPAPRQLNASSAMRLQIVGAAVSASISVMPRAVSTDADVQQIAGILALLTGGAIASYCGLQAILQLSASPRDLLTRLDFMPHIYFSPLNSLSPGPRRKIGAFIRIMLGALVVLPFAAVVGHLHELPISLSVVLASGALAAFFQIGMLTLLQGLFLIRWAEIDEKMEP